MTTVLGNMLVEDPCVRCGSRWIWLLRYSSSTYDRFVCVCEECCSTVVVQPRRVLLARAAGRMRSWMFKHTAWPSDRV
jgi:hypothetical protein